MVPRPWIEYETAGAKNPKYCQPDALLLHPQRQTCYILEAKRNHVADAYFQLENRYKPVVRHLFDEGTTVVGIEVCNFFDCAVRVPEKPNLVDDIYEANPQMFNVLIMHP